MESDEHVERVIRGIERYKNEDPFLRLDSVVILGISGNPKAIPYLITLLGDTDSEIRETAAEFLEEYGALAVDPLVKALKDSNWEVQWSAASALKEIGECAVQELVPLLYSESWTTQWAAAEALMKMKPLPQSLAGISPEWKGVILEKSGEILTHFLESLSFDMKWRAVITLGELHDERAITPLIEALTHRDKQVRERAARTLGNFKDRRAVAPLINALQDDYFHVKIQAARSLGKIGDERAIAPLIQLFEEKREKRKYPPYISEAASFALSDIGEAAILPLIELLKDNASTLTAKYQSTEALKRIGAPAIPHIIEAMKDRSWKTGWGAIALGKIGDKRAIEPLIRALEDEDREIRFRIPEVLQNFQDTRAILPLVRLLEDEDHQVQGQAALALRKMGLSALEPVKAFSMASTGRAKGLAVWVLGAVGDRSVLGLLLEALEDPCWEVRKDAISALRDIMSRERKKSKTSFWEKLKSELKDLENSVVESITPLLKDPNREVKYDTIRCLGTIGTKNACTLLEEVLKDRDREARRIASKELEHIRKKGHRV
ncbi:MAG: HEAT repeat domain-containing protein [Theionarchaea archaeon]|nr:HEAT repeat domain-containing protein [Theionarchaea archaeon]